MRIWENEHLDALIVLASIFNNLSEKSPLESLSQLVNKTFSAASEAEFTALSKRAEYLDKLTFEKRQRWRDYCFDRLISPAKTPYLDENINPVQIARFLGRESETVQKLVLKKMQADLAVKIAQYLELNIDITDSTEQKVLPEIVDLVNDKFMANFIKLSDIYEPQSIDKFSVQMLNKFVYHLGLHEIALACRGIVSKETLASFLGLFSIDDSKEIVEYLTNLQTAQAFWVAQADEIVRKQLESGDNPEQIIRKIGLRLLSSAYVNRSVSAREYTLQKFSTNESIYLKSLLKETEVECRLNNEQNKLISERQSLILKQAEKFNATGRL